MKDKSFFKTRLSVKGKQHNFLNVEKKNRENRQKSLGKAAQNNHWDYTGWKLYECDTSKRENTPNRTTSKRMKLEVRTPET